MPEALVAAPPATITAIITRLQDAGTFGAALIRYGLLAQLPTERERVYLLGVSSFEREPWSGGHRVRRETYDVRGLVEVHLTGTAGAESAVGRAWQLLDTIDDTLLLDPDLVTAEYTCELRVIADEVVPMSDGWLSRVFFRLGMRTSR